MAAIEKVIDRVTVSNYKKAASRSKKAAKRRQIITKKGAKKAAIKTHPINPIKSRNKKFIHENKY